MFRVSQISKNVADQVKTNFARHSDSPLRAQPILPEFGGPCLTNLVPALISQLSHEHLCLDLEDDRLSATLPDWIPSAFCSPDQIVVLVIDGLGREQLDARRILAPTLCSGGDGAITSVAPSTTVCALTSLTTASPPSAHGIVGYRVCIENEVMNLLTWRNRSGDQRVRYPPAVLQSRKVFPGLRNRVPVVSRYDYGPTGFSAVHLGHASMHPWHTSSGIVVEISKLLAAGEPFIYAYYDGIDRVAHAQGLGEHYDAELRVVDRIVGDIIECLPSGAALVVTADHGQVDVGSSVEVLGHEVMDGVRLLSGEGRFRWLHVQPGATDDVASAAAELYGDLAWVKTKNQAIEQGWFGGEPLPEVSDRLGDVLLAPFADTAFMDPSDTGELRLQARHGSLTSAEMMVPLLSWQAQ